MTKLVTSICAALTIAAVNPGANAATSSWSREQDSGLGFHFSYPLGLFGETKGDEKPSFHYFVSPLEPGTIGKAARLINLSAGSWQMPEATTS